MYIKSSIFLLLAFATAFFPRVLQSFGAPGLINFIHFMLVPVACGLAIAKTRTKDQQQIITVKQILSGLVLFLIIELISALWNGAGVINVALSFLLWTEPFMFLAAVICLPMSEKSNQRFRNWVIYFNFAHLLLALIQCFVLGYRSDNVQGVFYRSGAGHVVGSSVSLSFALYFFTLTKSYPLWVRFFVIFLSLVHLVLADAKQVLLTFVAGFALLSVIKSKDIGRTLIYAIGLVIFWFAFSWGVENIPAMYSFQTWMRRTELYGPNGAATQFKLSGIQAIIGYFSSPLNWFIGLGPGHSIDRLGGWMLRDYGYLLEPLGVTSSPLSNEVWSAMYDHWLGPRKGTSLFASMWSWAGMWGDLGFAGLFTYLYTGWIVWRKLCVDDISRLLLLTIIINGFIFIQMQEPAYMLSTAVLLALRWQDLRATNQSDEYLTWKSKLFQQNTMKLNDDHHLS